MKKLNLHMNDREANMVSDLGGKVTPMASACVENFVHLRRYMLQELKGIFTEAEILAMADNFNGTMYQPEWAANKGAYIAHLQDGDTLENLGKRWKADINALCKKIESLTSAHCLVWQFELYRFWELPNAYNNNLHSLVEAFK